MYHLSVFFWNCINFDLNEFKFQNENPAFDWNNQTEKPSLNINTIFNDCLLSIVYAPAIIFQNVVICGQALEFCVIKDMCLNFTLNDIDLLNDLRLKFTNVFRYIQNFLIILQ